MYKISVEGDFGTHWIADLENKATELDNTTRVPESSFEPPWSATARFSDRNRTLVWLQKDFWPIRRVSRLWTIFHTFLPPLHQPSSFSSSRLRL